MAKTVDPYYEWLGIPPKDQPPNHYRLLGVELFEQNRNVLDAAANRQMGFVKEYQAGEDSDLSQKLLNELAAARLCLLTPDNKAVYDAQLRSEMESRAAAATPAPDDRLQPVDGAASPGSPAVTIEPTSGWQGAPLVSSGPLPVDVKAAPPGVAARRAKRPPKHPGKRNRIILAAGAAAVAVAAIAVGFVVASVLFPQSDAPDRTVVQTPGLEAGIRPETRQPPESPETPEPEPAPREPAPEPVEEEEPEPAPAEEPQVPEDDLPPARTAESLEEAERRLTAAAEQTSSRADYQTVVHEVLALADRAIVDLQKDVAKRLATLALKAARRGELHDGAREATLLLIDLDDPIDDAARQGARQRLIERSGQAPEIDRQLPATSRVRVLCYNIQHGRGMDRVVDLQRIAEVIRRVEADVVALQEVDYRTARTGGVDQAAELGRLTGMQAVFGRAIDVHGGQYGNAILSRWPIVDNANHPLPYTEELEARAALAATIDGQQAGRFILISTQMQHDSADDRLAQARKLNQLFAEDGRADRLPMILAADVSAVPGTPPVEEFLSHWTDTTPDSPEPTFPAHQPQRKIDYVFYRPADQWRVVEATVVDEPLASDHRPLLVVFQRVRAAGTSTYRRLD